MKVKQKQGLDRFAKIKYSQIKDGGNWVMNDSRNAMGVLIKNGYTVMSGFYINEIMNLIRALREMKLEYTMKTINNAANKEDKNMLYEFTLGYFEDDRE